MSDDGDEWATLDELLGAELAGSAPKDIAGALAFYGRCSTEDNQDPETSLGWQLGNARKFVEPLGGQVVAEFFDVGQSRSVPWARREAAARLLAELRRPDRGWGAVVVGEATRCWFGNQFSLTAPRFAAHSVELWVPELGGRFDPRNPSHKMLMNVLGGMSESERQHVQARVRAAMDTQVVNEGRHQGGRPPYGYLVVDGGPHPNPRKAAEGYRLRVLAIDEPCAEVVCRIFAEYLGGLGVRAIANGLNRDGVPCPSARRPEQNRHRLADGWQGSTVRAILDNPRYTGYAVFGRWTKYETLLDPNDVAAGYVVRFRRSSREQIVRSRMPAHPPIVSVQRFTDAQLLRRSRAAGGPAAWAKLERGPSSSSRAYPLRGCIRCGYCGRKMQPASKPGCTYYRCTARSLVPGSPVHAVHPRTVHVREDSVVRLLNAWIGRLFDAENRTATLARLAIVACDHAEPDQATETLARTETRLRRLQQAIEAGVDPAALADALNKAHAEHLAARTRVHLVSDSSRSGLVDVTVLIDRLGDVGQALNRTDPAGLERLYSALRLELTYRADSRVVDVTIRPHRMA